MTNPSRRALTKIGFRRDVRIFLIALVGFLALLMMILLLVMQQFSQLAQQSMIQQWNAVADAGADQLALAPSDSVTETRAQFLLARYALHSIEIVGPVKRTFGIASATGETLTRQTNRGTIRFTFDDSELRSIQKRFAVTASICLAAAAAGMALLLLFIPRITGPIEEMLGEAKQLATRDESQDETTYLVQTFRDTIARLRDQEQEVRRLHESEKSRADELEMVTATLTRSLTSGFIAVGADGRVREMNAAAREMLGIAPARDVSVPVPELIEGSALIAVLQRAIEQRETVTRVEVDHTLGAHSVTIGLTAVPLIGEGSKLLGTLALFTDLTPYKRLESRVRAMQTLAELGEIAAGIAHEFRNSLATILSYLKLTQRMELPPDAGRKLRAAETEANELNAAVQRLLMFAKPMALQREQVDLRELVDGIVERLRPQAAETEFDVAGDASLEGDRALLGRALENVVRNAIDAVADREANRRVEIRIANDPASIVIADNGIGFDAAESARLLLPFVSSKPNGFGLGLPLARKIAILHGGELELWGEPGAGARVTMHFAGGKEAGAG